MPRSHAIALLMLPCVVEVNTLCLPHTCTRRSVLGSLAAPAVAASAPLAVWAADDVAKARAQMASSLDSRDELLKNFDEIVEADGGNGVRRVLGKLGPTSPLHRIDKPANILARSLEDDRSFELIDQFLGELDAADGDAYSSIFVPTGGGTTPEYWLARSRKEVTKTRGTLAAILELE